VSADRRIELLKEFTVYDTAVDIVSSWEAIMNYTYADEFSNFYFDRFPSLDTNGDDVTPDFTVFVNEKYGFIGEVKRTFPDDRIAILSTLDQLKSYDNQLGLQNNDGDYVVPETCDIVVIIEGSSAPQIGTRLQRIITEDKEVLFNNYPVLLRYTFNQDALMSRYEFQRVTELEFEFQDNQLEVKDTLSELVGEAGDYNTLKGWPKHFKKFKVQKPLCNDAPPGPYLATVLWHKIFPGYLTERQAEQFQATNGSKELQITVTADDLTDGLDDYMHDGQVRKIWVRRALDFLEGADLAENEDGDKYEIGYMGLVRNVGQDSVQEGIDELDQTRELGQTFIRRYCEKTGEEEEPEIEAYEEDDDGDLGEQSGLGNFM
jgi:hypothetical protein